MHLEEFAEGNSIFHKLDPRVKFISLMPYIFIIAVMKGLNGPIVALFISIIMIFITRIDLKKIISRLFVVNIFIVLLWVFIPFSYPGAVIFSLGPLDATREGLLFVLSMTLKANAIVLATIAILGTSEVFTLAHALVHLKVPLKLIYLFFFFYRYISVMHEEYSRLKKAIAVRAFKPKTNIHTYKTYAYLVGMLIVKSFDRSQRIYNAMLCRGFKGKFPIVSHFSLSDKDVFFGLLMFIITILIILISVSN
ncbi:MAG: cobalt ECF transporter T component CbiQ [Nitrospirae bacterium]|nr:cobalt ECF transporter T component CbiQ [Nitrospirota bacterium]